MAKVTSGNSHRRVVKRTSQGGSKPKTSSMSRTQNSTHKTYHGQGR